MQWCMLPANRRILDKLDGVRFLFIVQVIAKAQKKAQFSFRGQRKAFHYEIVLRGIQPYFLHGGALGLFSAVLKCNQGVDVLENFEVHIYSMVKEIYIFINVSYTLNSFWYRCLNKNYNKCAQIGDGMILC